MLLLPPSILTRIGGRARLRAVRHAQRLGLVGAALRSVGTYPRGARAIAFRILLQQVRFTALHALPLVTIIAVIFGGVAIVQAYGQAVRLGVVEVLGGLLATLIVRDLGPVLTAIVVIARSGTAITAELASADANGETEGLDTLGVGPIHYFAVPRIIATGMSVMILTVHFTAAALVSALVAAALLGQVSPAQFAAALRLALSPADILIVLVRGVLFGAGVGTICVFEGLQSGGRSTDIPQAVTRAVVASLLFVFLLTAAFSFALFSA